MIANVSSRLVRWALLGTLGMVAATGVHADEVVTKDGSVLKGKIVKIYDGKVLFKTAFAGEITLPQDQVASFTTDTPVAVRTESGDVAQGPVRATGSQLQVTTASGTMTTNVGAVKATWPAGEKDPAVAANEAVLQNQLRQWAYEASLDISGKAGNTEKSGMSARVQATLEGPRDRLRMYSSFDYANDGDDTTSRELIGGFSYTNFFTEKWGWYVREELEKDEFEGIDLRSVTAFGGNYRFLNEERLKFEARTGLSYRYESYRIIWADNPDTTPVEDRYTPDSEGYLGLDFGFDAYWRFADWGEMKSLWTYTPAFEDFGRFIIQQDTSVNIPLAKSNQWKLGLGVSNTYNSEPEGNKENLDTTYFTRLILNWK